MKGWSAGRAMAHGISEDARALRTARGLCDCDLQLQNALYQGTGGVSANNRAAGFAPPIETKPRVRRSSRGSQTVYRPRSTCLKGCRSSG